MDLLAPALESEPELRVAAALTSGFSPGSTGPQQSLRALLVGLPPTRKEEWVLPEVPGYGHRALVDVLADAAVRREQRPTPGEPDPEGSLRGVRYLTRHAYTPHWGDAHAWAAGHLNDARVEFAVMAFLSVRWEAGVPRPRGHDGEVVPDLAVLQVLASGRYPAPGSSEGTRRQGMPQGWANRLRAGQVGPVLTEATALVNRLQTHTDHDTSDGASTRHHFAVPRPSTSGPRLLAALLANPSPKAATRLDPRFTTPSHATPHQGEDA